jgi:hypothetical protein
MKPAILEVKTLDQAKAELAKIGVHPVGVEIMALKAVYRVVKFEGIDPHTANIVKQEMLSRGGEVAVSESVGKFEEKNTDMIILGNLAQYVRLIRKLRKQTSYRCQEVANLLSTLLFEGSIVDLAPVW